MTKDSNGLYKYSIVVWSDIKKSIKSSIAAAINLYLADQTEYGEFYVIANDLKQADSRVAHYIRRAIQLNPKLRAKYKTNGYRTIAPHGSYIEAIPIDPSGEAGSNAEMITFSELWGANEEAKQTMWAEMTLSPTKYGKSFRWIESYAGFSEESQLLYTLYELGVKKGRLLWPDRVYDVTDGAPSQLEAYVNDDARMICLWNTQPRCPWQTKQYYASEESVLKPNQFARMHRNQWASSTETFVPMEWYDACKRLDSDWPEIDNKKQAMVVSLDAAVSGDTFGLWLGCRHPQLENEVLTVIARRWLPPKGGKLDFIGTDEHPGPEKFLEYLIKSYNIVEVAYDPYQLHDMATRMNKKGLAWFRPFNQNSERLIADSQLHDIIRDRRFWHRGEADLREHMQNANAETGNEDRKMRIVKRVESLKIDLAVCASMGSHEILRLNL